MPPDPIRLMRALIPPEQAIEEGDFLFGRALTMYQIADLTFEQVLARVKANWDEMIQLAKDDPEAIARAARMNRYE